MDALQPWAEICSALCVSGSLILAFKPHTEKHVKNTLSEVSTTVLSEVSAVAPGQTPAHLDWRNQSAVGHPSPSRHPSCPRLVLYVKAVADPPITPLRKGHCATVTAGGSCSLWSNCYLLTLKGQ